MTLSLGRYWKVLITHIVVELMIHSEQSQVFAPTGLELSL